MKKRTTLEGIVVHTPTQKEYDELMQFVEKQEMFWSGRQEASLGSYWNDYKENTCVILEKHLSYASKSYFEEEGNEVISFKQFKEEYMEEKEFKGDLKGFPKEVVTKMLERQEEQVNKKDISVFEYYKEADKEGRGFTWNNTEEGHLFWGRVIEERDFDLFFEKYPKEPILKEGDLVYVSDTDPECNIIRRIFLFKDKNGEVYCVNGGNERDYLRGNSRGYSIISWKYSKPIPVQDLILEVTLEEIAEKFGVEVSKLKIKK